MIKTTLAIVVSVMAKIEKWEALDNLEEIADTFDGLMVARGDLGVEIDVTRVPLAQKKVIEIAGVLGKPVVISNCSSSVRNIMLRDVKAESHKTMADCSQTD